MSTTVSVADQISEQVEQETNLAPRLLCHYQHAIETYVSLLDWGGDFPDARASERPRFCERWLALPVIYKRFIGSAYGSHRKYDIYEVETDYGLPEGERERVFIYELDPDAVGV